MQEIWKDIENYEGIYQVSNFGKVKRLPTKTTMRNQSISWIQELPEYIFTPSLDSKGYPQVALSIGGNKRTARVHRLVAEAFLSPPSDELISECLSAGVKYVPINHIDANTQNNHFKNLEWCSPKHNNDWCVKVGNHKGERLRGANNYNVELSESDVLEIVNSLNKKECTQQVLADKFGVKQITISNIWTGRSWSWLTGIPKTEKTKKRKARAVAESEIKELPREVH